MLCSSVVKQQLARHRRNFAPPTRQTRKFHGKSQKSDAKREGAAWCLVPGTALAMPFIFAHKHTNTYTQANTSASEINTYPQAHHLFTVIQVLTEFSTGAHVVLELKAALCSFRRFTVAAAAQATTTTLTCGPAAHTYLQSRFGRARAYTANWHILALPDACTYIHS